jgi:putative phosphoribosyl transferase
VAPPEAVHRISQEADEVICLETPPVLYAIGYHFRDFSPVSDDDVIAVLRDTRAAHAEVGAGRSPGGSGS